LAGEESFARTGRAVQQYEKWFCWDYLRHAYYV
jgi:hypothetical protein